MPNDTLTAVDRVLDELDALADIWAAETNIAASAAQIASAPHAEKRAEAIRAMMHLSFVEGAYRTALAKQAQAAQKLPSRESMARALSIPQHHTGWEHLSEQEKDLFYMQADYALAELQQQQKLPSQTVLVEALKPFADKAERTDTSAFYGNQGKGDGYTVAVTLGDCRRARTAIAEATAAPAQDHIADAGKMIAPNAAKLAEAMPNDTLTAVANELSLFATGKLDEGSEAFFREALQVALERTRTALAKQARPEPVNDLPAPPGPATITPSPTGGNP